MKFSNRFFKCFTLMFILFILPAVAFGLNVPNPDQIEVEGLVSFGEDGAAWLNYKGHEILVTSGYMIGTDLRVVAVRHDSVVLYRPNSKQYHVLLPKSDLAFKDRTDVIWTQAMPIWKITRMAGLAYRKDYICNFQTGAQNVVRSHVRGLPGMMEKVVSPHHRYYGRDGIIFVAPVHVQATGWKVLMDRIQNYRSKTLSEWFGKLNENGTIISDGKPLDQVLQKIAYKTGVRLIWEKPVKMPLYCSLRDRPWHEILATIVVFNCLDLYPTAEGIVIR